MYQLALSDDPTQISTEDFERDGRLYFLLDMTREDSVGVVTRPHIETITAKSDTDDLQKVLAQTDCETVTYTAIFGSMPIPEEQTSTETPTEDGCSVTAEPMATQPLVIGAVVWAMAVGGVFAVKKFKERRS